MALGYAHVEGPVGHLLHHDVHGAARGHGRRHPHDLRVLPCQFQERLAKHLLVFSFLRLVFAFQYLARFGVELARCVPNGGVVLGRRIAVAFLRVQVEQLGAFHLLQLAQNPHQVDDAVAVERAEIANVHAIEDVLLVADGALQGVAQADEAFATVVLQHAVALKEACGAEAHLVVGLVGAQAQQILLHAAHGAVD